MFSFKYLEGRGNIFTLVTATWNVYSLTGLGVVFENLARTVSTESRSFGLDTVKEILTAVFETIRFFVLGNEEPSSGKAELKFQSSSEDSPLVC